MLFSAFMVLKNIQVLDKKQEKTEKQAMKYHCIIAQRGGLVMLTDTKLRNLKPEDKLYKVNDCDVLYRMPTVLHSCALGN